MIKRSDLVLTLTQRLLLLCFIFIFCYALTALLVAFIAKILADNAPASLRIGTTLQDVFAFIVPAVATAVITCRRPDRLLCITTKPKASAIFLVLLMLVVSIPIQENIIYWNYHLELPQSMDAFAAKARAMEDMANGAMLTMMGSPTVGSLIVNLLIIGFAAGFAEELLFRGCFLRLLTTGGVNRHVAVWIVAIIFSAMHFQLFGFIPRMLLGAYFGYLLLWTGSLWAPILAHTLNNMLFVAIAWIQLRAGEPITDEPIVYPTLIAICSAIATTATLYALHRTRPATCR